MKTLTSSNHYVSKPFQRKWRRNKALVRIGRKMALKEVFSIFYFRVCLAIWLYSLKNFQQDYFCKI